MLLMAFLPQFRESFSKVSEEDIDKILGIVEEKIQYIKEG